MANVAGTTAQTVADQMTAVWNNFYDGSKSIEYYSDVMVALGAATASSTDEISEGVNKFAATAKTVGLSYEYATSALATLTATTRESADTVGNALKTIFARLQGLTLGDTLEDGTDLNKYSKALDAVGVSIKTTDGQLKDMDTILDELGAKWQTLGKDQQMALAQTVAGVRQYATLIALMNNYDYFKENLGVAYGAEGTLEKQSEIYAESWEAAEKRVRAAMQGIYQSLIDDKFFIGINNALAEALGGLDAFIDAAGGLPTILTTIGSIFLSVFANKMPEAFKNLKYNLDVLTKGANAAYQNIVDEMKTATKQGYDDYAKSTGTQGIDPNSSSGYALQAANDLTIARSKLAEVNDQLNSSEQQRYNTELSLIDQQQQEIVGLKQKAETLQEIITTVGNELADANAFDATDKMFNSVNATITKSLEDTISFFDLIKNNNDYDDFGRDIQQVGANISNVLVNALREGKKGVIDLTQAFGPLRKDIENVDFSRINADNFKEVRDQVIDMFKAFPDGIKNVTGLSAVLRNLEKSANVSDFTSRFQDLQKFLQNVTVESNKTGIALRGMADPALLKKYLDAVKELPIVQKEAEEGQKRINQALEAFQPTHVVQGLEAITAGASGLGNIVAVINQIKGALSSLNNDDLTVGEKITSFFSSLAFVVPSTISFLKNYGTVVGWLNQQETKRVETQNAIIAAENTRMEQEAIAAQMAKARQGVELGLQETIADGIPIYDLEKFAIATGLTQEEARQALAKAGINTMKLKTQAQQEVLAADEAQVAQQKEVIAQEVAETLARKTGNMVRKEAIVLSKALNKVSKIAMIISALVALGTILAQLIPKAKDTTKAFEEANQAYENQQTVVNDLKSKLEELNKTIDELRNKGPLSLIEQEQLNKAETQKAITEQQLKLEQQLLELRQKNAASAFIEDINNKKNQPKELKDQIITDKYGNQYIISANITDKNQFASIIEEQSPSKKYTTTDIDFQGSEATVTQEVIEKIIKHLGLDNKIVEQKGLLQQTDFGNYENFNNYLEQFMEKNPSAYEDLAKWVSQSLFTGWNSDNWRNAIEFNQVWAPSNNLEYTQEDLQAMKEQFDKIVDNNISSKAELLASYKEYLSTYQNLFMQGALDSNQITQSINFLKQYQNELWGDNKSQMYEDLGIDTIFGQSKNYEQVYKALLSTDDVSQIIDKVDDDFKKRLESMGIDAEDYFQNWIDRLAEIKKNFSGDPLLLQEVFNSKKWKPQYLKFIEKVLGEGLTDAQSIFNRLDELIAEEAQNVNTSLDEITATLNIASKLKNVGDTISDTDYASLGDKYKEYFQLQNDGTAILIKSAKDFYDTVYSNSQKELKDQIVQDLQDIDDLKQQKENLINSNETNQAYYRNLQERQKEKEKYEKTFEEYGGEEKLYELYRKERDGTITTEESNILGYLNQSYLLMQYEDRHIEGVRNAGKEFFDALDQIENNQNSSKEQLQADQLKLANLLQTVEDFIALRDDAEFDWFSEIKEQLPSIYNATLAKQAANEGFTFEQIKGYSQYLQLNKGQKSEEADINSLQFFTIKKAAENLRSNVDNFTEIIKGGEDKIAQNISTIAPLIQNLLGIEDDLSDPKFYSFFIDYLEEIIKLSEGDTSVLQTLTNALAHFGVTVSGIDVDSLGSNPYAITPKETKTWRSGYDERSKIISGLTEDQTITLDDYNKLLAEQQELFRVLDDGTYVLNDNLGSVEENLQRLHELEIQAAQDAGQNVGLIANSLRELDGMLTSGKITEEQYKDAFDTVYGKDISKYGFDKDEVDNYAESLQEVNKALQDQPQLARKIALEEKKQAKAVEDLGDNYEDYAKVLAEANKNQKIKNTEKYSKAIQSLRKDLSLLTGMEEKAFSEDFINSEAVQQALADIANGVEGSVEKLKLIASMDYIKVKVGIDEETFSTLYSQIEELNAQDIEIGATIDNAPALDALADLLNQSNMTAEQMQAIFNALGWEPEIEYVPVDVDTATALRSMGYQQYATLRQDGGYDVKPIPLSGEQSLAAGSQIYVPKIKSKSMGGGSYKKIDAPTPTLGNKKASSGGGGGGSSKHPEKKNDSDKERYHTVLNQLEDLNAEYDDISKAKDRAFGKDRLAYMDAEIKKTDELIAKQGEYLDEIKSYLPVDKAVLEATYKDLIGGPNMLFDEKGNISNFDAIQDAMYAKYNEMTEKFTEDDEQWDIFQKQYEQLEKYLDKYEETYDLLRDEEQKYQDLINQRIDAQLEKVQYKVEVKLDVSKDEIAVLEYQLGRIDDDAFKSIEAIDLLFDKSVQLKKQIEINKQGLNDALALSLSAAEISEVMAGNMSVLEGKNLTDNQIQAIKDYRDNLLGLNEELDDIRENIEDKVLDAFDAWNEKLTAGIDIIDSYSSVLEHFKNIVDIVGQDTLGLNETFMQNLSQTTVDNSINKVKAAKAAMESTMAAQEKAQKSLDEARARGDEKSQKMWEDTLKQIDEDARSAQDSFLQAWEDALNGLADQFEQTVDRVVKNFNKTVYDMGGLEGLANDFSKQKEDSDMMLDDYQKIYELSKLSRDINKTIDDTDIISGKQKLKKLLEQVNDLQADGVKMSQYDLEYLQKTYDLRLAELELEEAQRAKNTVRLQKDSEGNWAYIYTQSTDAIDSAQQKYEDALYAMQDLSSNYIDEMSEKLINTSQEMADALAALRVQDFASLDDYYREVEKVQKQYQDRMALQEDELNKAIANNKELYDTDWMNYHNATGYKISDTENFATSFKNTLLGALMQSDTDSSNFTELLGQSVQQLTNGLMQAAETYYTNLENAMNAAGTSTNTFGDDISKVIEDIKAKSAEGGQAVEDMANQMNNAINDTIETVENWQKTYSEAMEKIIQSNLDVINSFNELIKTLGADANDININYDIKRGTSSAQRFATGGYTGEWGSSGKLAILDEKELILNQNDTANMLSAIQLTREIMNAIDIGANYASLGFGNLVATSLRDNNKEVLEQNVHITAEFPNVNDHNEIELALRNLTNTASQYANRK